MIFQGKIKKSKKWNKEKINVCSILLLWKINSWLIDLTHGETWKTMGETWRKQGGEYIYAYIYI